MAATKVIKHGSPSAGDTLELGVSGETVQLAAGTDFCIKDIGAITATTSATQAANPLTYTVNNVTSGADTHSVLLPAGVAGLVRYVYVGTGAYAVNIYPATGGTINGGSANAQITIKEKTYCELISIDASNNWIARYTVNS